MKQRDVVDRWYEALRSGKYKQGFGNLCYEQGGETYHCALGVLADVAGFKVDHFLETTDGKHRAFYERSERNIKGATGLDGPLGISKSQENQAIWRLNDADCYTFEQIADYVQEHESDYFTFTD